MAVWKLLAYRVIRLYGFYYRFLYGFTECQVYYLLLLYWFSSGSKKGIILVSIWAKFEFYLF